MVSRPAAALACAARSATAFRAGPSPTMTSRPIEMPRMARDALEAASLYDLLEREVHEALAEVSGEGLPRED